jgi:hypothetical protein
LAHHSLKSDLGMVGALFVLWLVALGGIAWVGFTLDPPAIWVGWWGVFILGGLVIAAAAVVAVKDSAVRHFH